MKKILISNTFWVVSFLLLLLEQFACVAEHSGPCSVDETGYLKPFTSGLMAFRVLVVVRDNGNTTFDSSTEAEGVVLFDDGNMASVTTYERYNIYIAKDFTSEANIIRVSAIQNATTITKLESVSPVYWLGGDKFYTYEIYEAYTNQTGFSNCQLLERNVTLGFDTDLFRFQCTLDLSIKLSVYMYESGPHCLLRKQEYLFQQDGKSFVNSLFVPYMIPREELNPSMVQTVLGKLHRDKSWLPLNYLPKWMQEILTY